MSCKDEIFVTLVQARAAIYDSSLKDHHNKNIIYNLWKEIGQEMNMTNTDCKQKWTNLRNSFARQMRDDKNQPSGPGAGKRRKPWYLAEVMSFLKDHMQPRTSISRAEKDPDDIATFTNSEDKIRIEVMMQPDAQFLETGLKLEHRLDEVTADEERPPEVERDGERQSKRLSPTELVAGPMIEFLKSNTKPNLHELDRHPLQFFLRSMIPDYDKLLPKRQRLFQQQILSCLHHLVEEQETESERTSVSCSISEAESM